MNARPIAKALAIRGDSNQSSRTPWSSATVIGQADGSQGHAGPVGVLEAFGLGWRVRQAPADQRAGKQQQGDRLPIDQAQVRQGVGPQARQPDRYVGREGGGHGVEREAMQPDRRRQEFQRGHHQHRDQRAAGQALQAAQRQEQRQAVNEGQDQGDQRAQPDHAQVEPAQRERDGEPRSERHGDEFARRIDRAEPGGVVQALAQRAADVRQGQRADPIVQPGRHGRKKDARQRDQGARAAFVAGCRRGARAHCRASPSAEGPETAAASQPPPSAL